jgi:hypothetical protein
VAHEMQAANVSAANRKFTTINDVLSITIRSSKLVGDVIITVSGECA